MRALCLALTLSLAGFNAAADDLKPAVTPAKPLPFAFGSGVQSITVPHDEPFLPEGPGRTEFVANCVICHSPRYVTNQPLFGRKTWDSEVHKMVKMYGAPIAESDMKAITDYLMFFHGKEGANP